MKADQQKGPDDTTAALADLLNDYHADLFVTSGHDVGWSGSGSVH